MGGHLGPGKEYWSKIINGFIFLESSGDNSSFEDVLRAHSQMDIANEPFGINVTAVYQATLQNLIVHCIWKGN